MIFRFDVRRTPLGWVAAFCPFCRGPRACALLAVKGKRHSALFGQRPLPEREVRCGECGVRWPVRAERYPRAAATPGEDFVALKAATVSAFDEEFGDRLATEARLARGALTAREREHLLREPFLYAEHLVGQQESYPQPSPFVKRAGTVGLVAFAGFLVALGVHEASGSDLALSIMGVLILVALTGALLIQLYGLFTARSWFRKRCVEPALVRALRPLQPSRAELEEVFDGFRREKALVARVLDPARLHGLLEEP